MLEMAVHTAFFAKELSPEFAEVITVKSSK